MKNRIMGNTYSSLIVNKNFRTLLLFDVKINQKNFSHRTWLTTAIATINSTFVVDCATISCFLEHHEKIPKPRLKQYPELLFISSKEPP